MTPSARPEPSSKFAPLVIFDGAADMLEDGLAGRVPTIDAEVERRLCFGIVGHSTLLLRTENRNIGLLCALAARLLHGPLAVGAQQQRERMRRPMTTVDATEVAANAHQGGMVAYGRRFECSVC